MQSTSAWKRVAGYHGRARHASSGADGVLCHVDDLPIRLVSQQRMFVLRWARAVHSATGRAAGWRQSCGRTGPVARRREEVQLELGPRGRLHLGQRQRLARQPERRARRAAAQWFARHEHDVAPLAHLRMRWWVTLQGKCMPHTWVHLCCRTSGDGKTAKQKLSCVNSEGRAWHG